MFMYVVNGERFSSFRALLIYPPAPGQEDTLEVDVGVQWGWGWGHSEDPMGSKITGPAGAGGGGFA